jgi:hypothetical protein
MRKKEDIVSKQNIPTAFMTFFKDLPKAAFVCHASMIGAIGVFVWVGNHFTRYLVMTGKTDPKNVGWLIAVELIVIWLVAFALAVRIRPVRNEEFCRYPPINMLGGAFAVSIILGLPFGIISGNMMGFGVFKSILFVMPSVIAIPFLVIFLFVPTIPATLAAVNRKRDPTLAIADSYRNTWLFSALALLAIGFFLKWMAGEQPGLTPYFVTINSALITAVSYTGFASGFYP